MDLILEHKGEPLKQNDLPEASKKLKTIRIIII